MQALNHSYGQVFKWLINFSKNFWIGYLNWFFVAIVWAADISFRPYLIKLMVDDLAKPSGSVLYWLVLYTLVSFFIVIIFRIYDWLNLRYLPIMRQAVIEEMMTYALENERFILKHSPGDFTSKIQQASESFIRLPRLLVDELFAYAISLLFITITLFTVHPLLGLIFLGWIGFFLFYNSKINSKRQGLASSVASWQTWVMGYIMDILQNHLATKIYSKEKYEFEKIHKYTNDLVNHERRRDYFFLKNWSVQGIAFVSIQTLCLVFLYITSKDNSITAGDFVLVLTLLISSLDILGDISYSTNLLSEAFGRLVGVISMIPERHMSRISKPNLLTLSTLQVEGHSFDIENIYFSYTADRPLFCGLSLHINAFERIGLVGPSGGGKTTLTHLFIRLWDIEKGSIQIDKQDIRSLEIEYLRKQITYIPQEPLLLERSIEENILYANGTFNEDEIHQAAMKAHAHDFILALPQGYKTILRSKGEGLSGGQKQRIALARAFLRNAPVVILDEPTSALDLQTDRLIQESFNQLFENKTVIVIAHRLETLKRMDRILVMDKGKIVEEGTHEELLMRKGLYEKLWKGMEPS